MTEIKFITKDSEIDSKEIDRLCNKHNIDFTKVTTDNGWNYLITSHDAVNGERFYIILKEEYPNLSVEFLSIE